MVKITLVETGDSSYYTPVTGSYGQTVVFDNDIIAEGLVCSGDSADSKFIMPMIYRKSDATKVVQGTNYKSPRMVGSIGYYDFGKTVLLKAGVEYVLVFAKNNAENAGFSKLSGGSGNVVTVSDISMTYVGDSVMSTSQSAMPYSTWLPSNIFTIGVFGQTLASGKLKDQAPGTVVKFANSLWTILDAEKGYLMKNDSLSNVKFDSYDVNGGVFNPSKTTNIGYLLNTTYYNTLYIEEKAAIQSHDWGIGALTGPEGWEGGYKPSISDVEMENKENQKTVNAKIGLLSNSEWRKYFSLFKYKFTTNYPDGQNKFSWLRTSVYNEPNKAWALRYNGLASLATVFVTMADVLPTLYINADLNISGGEVGYNSIPIITLSTTNAKTLYENDTILVDGTAKDTDKNDIVNIWYQINSGSPRATQTRISDGITDIPFSEQLTFKGGKLYLPDGTALTGSLAEGIAHKLKVWAEDNKGGKSIVEERTFYVVPNRPPKLTINPFTPASDLIDVDKIAVSGTTSDPDGNDTVVSYKLNSGLATEVYRGPESDWSFDLLLKSLKDGENTIVVETVDAYNFKTSLTRKLNKQANLTPLAKSVQRYTLVPPAGTAQGVLMWIERDATQSITAEISMTNGTEQEQFKPMTLDSSGPANVGTVEDFFKFRADIPAEKIAIKLSWTGNKPIFKVSGALTQ